MEANTAQRLNDAAIERGRRLVILAFSPDHQRLRSPSDAGPLIKRVTTADRSSLGGFNPTRCHAPSQRPAKYSEPIRGRFESVEAVMREIRSLPVIYQLWLHVQYRAVRHSGFDLKLHALLCALYRREYVSGPIRTDTLSKIDVMIKEHLRYLRGMDIPPAGPMGRKDAGAMIREIKGDAWKQTYSKYWRLTYQAILTVDIDALIRLDTAI